MGDTTRHQISEERLARAREDIRAHLRERVHWLSRTGISLEGLGEMGGDLLDHLAARVTPESARDDHVDEVLDSAAECFMGVLDVGCFPDGDVEMRFALTLDSLSTVNWTDFTDVSGAPDARDWLDAFAVCVIGGRFSDWKKARNLGLRGDYAEAIRTGLPYSRWTPDSRPADLAAMDALCLYVSPGLRRPPPDLRYAPLQKPDAAERAEAARQLDAVDGLTPDRRLLRVLLDDDRAAFEDALAARLAAYPQEMGPDPAPRTLLPMDTLALAALAVQVHGWEPTVVSAYLPHSLLGSTDTLRRAAEEYAGIGGGG